MTPGDADPIRSPERASGPLLAMLHEARGDWNAAHELVQDDPSREASRVHAYLHRREGDEANARYWYARAGVAPFAGPLDREREELIRSLGG